MFICGHRIDIAPAGGRRNGPRPGNHRRLRAGARPFQALERNNIFDQSRVPHDYRPGSVRRPPVETVTLCGTAVDDSESNAVFQGSDGFYKAGQTIKGLKIVKITLNSVTLADATADAPTNSIAAALTNSVTNSAGSTLTNSTGNAPAHPSDKTFVTHSVSNTFVLDMDIHPTLRREGDGPWRLSAYVASQPAPATNSATGNRIPRAGWRQG